MPRKLLLSVRRLKAFQEHASQIALDHDEYVRLDEKELHRLNRVWSPGSSVERERAPPFASLCSHPSGIAVIDVMSQIGSELVHVSKGLRPSAIESTNRVSSKDVHLWPSFLGNREVTCTTQL